MKLLPAKSFLVERLDVVVREREGRSSSMALFRMTLDSLEPVATTSFTAELVKERQDLQRLLRAQIDLLGDDLMVVAEEYGDFQDSRRRIDLLAVDTAGRLVVIELKRTDDGGHMELQALRYAAMVSTMTFDQLVMTFASNNKVPIDEARQRIDEWITGPDDADEVGSNVLQTRVRIVLVAADFNTEITSTVLWLNDNYRTDIRCFRLVPYKLGADVLVDLQQLIPLPEAADFQIRQRDKELAAVDAHGNASSRDYTKYDIEVRDWSEVSLSKQAAVRLLVRRLLQEGVPGAGIREVVTPRRWLAVQPGLDEIVEDAFHAKYPDRGDGYWFDLGMADSVGVWVMPTLGGRKTETYLTALTSLAAEHGVDARWSRNTTE